MLIKVPEIVKEPMLLVKSREQLAEILAENDQVAVDRHPFHQYRRPDPLTLWIAAVSRYELADYVSATRPDIDTGPLLQKLDDAIQALNASPLPARVRRVSLRGPAFRWTAQRHHLVQYGARAGFGMTQDRASLSTAERFLTLAPMARLLGFDFPLPNFPGWRSHVESLEVMLADGTTLEVHGPDCAPWIGTRGTLGVILSATLRPPEWPKELPDLIVGEHGGRRGVNIHRVLPEHFHEALARHTTLCLADPHTSTFWFAPDPEFPRFPGDRVWLQNSGPANYEPTPEEEHQWQSWKQQYDPTNKFGLI